MADFPIINQSTEEHLRELTVGRMLSPSNELMSVLFPLLVLPKKTTFMWSRLKTLLMPSTFSQ